MLITNRCDLLFFFSCLKSSLGLAALGRIKMTRKLTQASPLHFIPWWRKWQSKRRGTGRVFHFDGSLFCHCFYSSIISLRSSCRNANQSQQSFTQSLALKSPRRERSTKYTLSIRIHIHFHSQLDHHHHLFYYLRRKRNAINFKSYSMLIRAF